MRYAFPCNIVRDEEEAEATGREAYVITFPDVPEAITGAWSWNESLEMAEDCLAVALGGHVKMHEDLPTPSPLADRQVLIAVPIIVAAKLTLYTAMREQNMSAQDLKAKLGMPERTIQTLLTPYRFSHISQIERALKAVGRSLIVEDMDAGLTKTLPSSQYERARCSTGGIADSESPCTAFSASAASREPTENIVPSSSRGEG